MWMKNGIHGWTFIHDDAGDDKSDDKRHDVGHNVGDVICDTFHPKNLNCKKSCNNLSFLVLNWKPTKQKQSN